MLVFSLNKCSLFVLREVAQGDFELTILLPLPIEYWDYRHAPLVQVKILDKYLYQLILTINFESFERTLMLIPQC